MKRLIVTLVVVFCCAASYAGESDTIKYISIKKSGGKIIKKGNNAGQMGFYKVTQKIDFQENGNYTIIVHSTGKGLNVPPDVYTIKNNGCSTLPKVLNTEVYDAIIAKIRGYIDLGETNGHFCLENFSCMWGKGEKNTNNEETNYGYVLMMINATSIIIDEHSPSGNL